MACQQNLAPLITAEAARQGVPLAIAIGVAQRETGMCHWDSRGNVVRGKAGEIGVMQVMPSTAPGANLYDVQANIRVGISYLAQMYAQFGDWSLAVAAYNAGPGAVGRALNNGSPVPSAGYVADVMGPNAAPNRGSSGTYAAGGVAATEAGISSVALAAIGAGAVVLSFFV